MSLPVLRARTYPPIFPTRIWRNAKFRGTAKSRFREYIDVRTSRSELHGALRGFRTRTGAPPSAAAGPLPVISRNIFRMRQRPGIREQHLCLADIARRHRSPSRNPKLVRILDRRVRFPSAYSRRPRLSLSLSLFLPLSPRIRGEHAWSCERDRVPLVYKVPRYFPSVVYVYHRRTACTLPLLMPRYGNRRRMRGWEIEERTESRSRFRGDVSERKRPAYASRRARYDSVLRAAREIRRKTRSSSENTETRRRGQTQRRQSLLYVARDETSYVNFSNLRSHHIT